MVIGRLVRVVLPWWVSFALLLVPEFGRNIHLLLMWKVFGLELLMTWVIRGMMRNYATMRGMSS